MPRSARSSATTSCAWEQPNEFADATVELVELVAADVVERCRPESVAGARFGRAASNAPSRSARRSIGSADSLEMVFELAGAGHVGETEANTGELAGQELGVGLRAFGDAAIDLGLHAVALLLPVLGQQDQRCRVGGLQREQQGEADELPLVAASNGLKRVARPIHSGDEHALEHEEAGGAESAGDRSR